VIEIVADGLTTAEILAAFPDLVAEDVEEALRYAAATEQDDRHPGSGPTGGGD
jgi:uncharacterized protein (DUF433 family)